jgi:hypothetical protein
MREKYYISWALVCVVMVILVTWEDEIRRIMVPGQIIFEIA